MKYSYFNKKIAVVLAATTLTAISLVGCSNQETLQNDQGTGNIESELTPYQYVSAQKKSAKFQDKNSRLNLVELPIDSKYNAEILVSTDKTIPQYANAAFIAPKIFAYGAGQGGMVSVKKNSSGNITISFNVAFIDGRNKTFIDSLSKNEITVPEPFLIKNWQSLEQTLANQFDVRSEKIGTLVGCPREITISYAGREYNVTPFRFVSGDYCPTGSFAVSMTVKANEAKDILYNQLPKGMIDIGMVYETKTSVPISKTSVKFSRKSIYNDLQLALGVKTWIVDAEAKRVATTIAKDQKMQVLMQGAVEKTTEQLVSRILNEFFVPFRANPNSPGDKECSSVVCLQLSSTILNQSDEMDFGYYHESNQLVGYAYSTSTKLKAIDRKSVLIGKDSPCLDNCGRLSSDGNLLNLNLRVGSGIVLNIKPEKLFKRRMQIDTNFNHQSNLFCPLTVLNKYGWSVNECNKLFHIPPGGTGKTVCNSCAVAEEDRWTDVTTYSAKPNDIIINNPGISALQNVFLSFSEYNSDGIETSTVRCSLNAFETNLNYETLSLKIEKNDQCNPFQYSNGPKVSIEMHGTFEPFQYFEGRYVENYQRIVSERPKMKTGFNVDELMLSLSIQEDDQYGLGN